jgi:hypothetical protein
MKVFSIKNITQWLVGGGLYYVFVWLYDYLVFSYVIWKYGAIRGGISMMILTFLVDVGTLKFYDWSKRDWLAIETVKELGETHGKVGRVFKWIHGKGFFLVIIFLSMKFNPFMVTAYLRKGVNQYDGLSFRDWVIFISSSLIGGIYWIVVIITGVSFLQYVRNLLFIN